MKKLFLLFFLVSCASPNLNYTTINKTFDFNKDLSFNEFNQLLIRYAESSPYPNIDK
jgi:ABC-type amino acid transport system permease subunit